MAAKPTPDRSDLESKSVADLQKIAEVTGAKPAGRSKAAIVDAIMNAGAPAASEAPSRAVRSRRTVATPVDDFDDLLGEFVADAKT